ncbi:MAG: pantoate--beta-alanine ligase [Gammaproteobacteria bacterium]|nr:pantoate--beta-alanine ligase [Gammaproteobacteria bacterium]MDH5728403.1 pantoate--beta-alanine ligase [Gammaproteobacteria bacterium]
MITAKNPTEIRSWIKRWHAGSQRIAFVPTMGNLHEGHLALCQHAKTLAERVVVSIYVNPMQFGPNEDFAAYPRTLEADQKALTRAGVDLLFNPDDKVMYPRGKEASAQIIVPELSDILCGQSRPGHFAGVATVVAKFFNIVQADLAIFGEKDFQQLQIIRRMVADLFIPMQIEGFETQRQDDGLALSSRNSYLSDSEQQIAPLLYQTLLMTRDKIIAGTREYSRLEVEAMRQLGAAGFEPEYFSIRNVGDLKSAQADVDTDLVILVAARLGKTRLIDNIRLELQNVS